MDVLIIGAGLFGSIAARLCRRAGHKVTLFDDRRQYAGSPPSACLIRPSWISSLGKKFTEPALETLDSLYKLQTLSFRTRVGSVDVHWVDPARVLYSRVRAETVLEVGDGYVQTQRGRYEGKVLVAAGVWSGALVKCPAIRSLTGCSLIYEGEPVENRITVWAPYKQAVSFSREPGHTWFGDGSAILQKNWTQQREIDSEHRALEHNLFDPKHIIVGRRPYIPSHKKGYFAKVHKNTWVCTGGAKNGTIMAAYYARKFLEAIS